VELLATDKFEYGEFVEESGRVHLLYGRENPGDASECDIVTESFSMASAASWLANPPALGASYNAPDIELDADGEPTGAADSGIILAGGPATLDPTLTVVDQGGTRDVEVSGAGLVTWPTGSSDALMADADWTVGARFVLFDNELFCLFVSNGTSSGASGMAMWVDDRDAVPAVGRVNFRWRTATGLVLDLQIDEVLTPDTVHTAIFSYKSGADQPILVAIDGYPVYSTLTPTTANMGGTADQDPCTGGILTTGGSTVDGGGQIGRLLVFEGLATHTQRELLSLHTELLGSALDDGSTRTTDDGSTRTTDDGSDREVDS
jgi:hypothetical protein